jgi:putative ABC transport system permease protein
MSQRDVLAVLQQLPSAQVSAAAPYLYIVARAQNIPVVVAGTWLDQAPRLDATWKLEGNWVASREDDSHCLVGRNVARRLHLAVGNPLALHYLDRSSQCSVAGVVDSGGAEDNQIVASLRMVQSLANLPGEIGVAQLSVTGTTQVIADYARRLTSALPQYQVRPIRQVAEAEGALLGRIRLLIVSMVLLILILTALCVLGTMAALAMERRKDVGLMKSLGGSISRIVGIFLAEVGVLGAVGGLLGTILGAALSYWMGLRVFGTAIAPRWEVFPVTITLTIVVTLAGALPLRMLGNVKPAEILRGA